MGGQPIVFLTVIQRIIGHKLETVSVVQFDIPRVLIYIYIYIYIYINHLFNTPTKRTLYISTFFTKPLVHDSVCYAPSSGRTSYTCSKLKLIMLIKIQLDATVCRYLFTTKVTLHVSGVTAPIIRSTKNCNRNIRYRSYCKIEGLTGMN